MSDTVKLIIEIPKEYKALFDTERCKSKFDSLATNEFGYVLRKAFENGTPLDDVKEQIRAKELVETDIARQYYNLALGDAINLLDYIGKAESED